MPVSRIIQLTKPPTQLPSEAQSLRLFLATHKEFPHLGPSVIMIIPSEAGLPKAVLYIDEDSTASYSGEDYLDSNYTFVRYLDSNESVTITGE